ncbi:unnamed protein product [Menidia menidia]|uniref:(Atlantic silverside) hypothetical protein n=1 Tax=Menidia menidia TaxID=238744 RepID=A0A8S4B238_9TELE|nr:unnamed protein product [Menidia menidia]
MYFYLFPAVVNFVEGTKDIQELCQRFGGRYLFFDISDGQRVKELLQELEKCKVSQFKLKTKMAYAAPLHGVGWLPDRSEPAGECAAPPGPPAPPGAGAVPQRNRVLHRGLWHAFRDASRQAPVTWANQGSRCEIVTFYGERQLSLERDKAGACRRTGHSWD